MSDVKSDISSRRFGGLFENLGVSAAIRVSPKPRPVFGIASSPEIGDKSSFLFDFTPFFDLLRSLLTEDATFHHGGALLECIPVSRTSKKTLSDVAPPPTDDPGDRDRSYAQAQNFPPRYGAQVSSTGSPHPSDSINGKDAINKGQTVRGATSGGPSRLSRPNQWDGCWNCRYRKMDYCSEIEQKVRDTEKACDSWLERGSIDD